MNKETMKLFTYMVNNPEWVAKIKEERSKNSNYKDFAVQTGHIIAQLNREKFQYSLEKVQLKKIIDMYF